MVLHHQPFLLVSAKEIVIRMMIVAKDCFVTNEMKMNLCPVVLEEKVTVVARIIVPPLHLLQLRSSLLHPTIFV